MCCRRRYEVDELEEYFVKGCQNVANNVNECLTNEKIFR